MMNRYLTYCLMGLALVLCRPSVCAQDVLPIGVEYMSAFGSDDLIGTARFIGMSGAMTAVGGDPSAVKLNPAGLGIYRHSQFSVTGAGQFRRFWQDSYSSRGPLYTRWHLSQVSAVFAFTHPERLSGVVSNYLRVSYAKRSDRVMHMTLNDRSLRRSSTADWVETTVDEVGYRNDADIHYAMNINNRFYWGIGLTFEWIHLRQSIDRWEFVNEGRLGSMYERKYASTDIGRTVGFAGSAGILIHPVQALRIGLAVESPTVSRMRETWYYDELISYRKTTGSDYEYNSPEVNTIWQMATPLNATAGLALQWKEHGLVSLQYDMQYHRLFGVAHTGRAGLELAFNRHWMLEAGYAYSTMFNRQRVAAAMNYMGRWVRVGVAYTYSWANGVVYDLDKRSGANYPFRANESKIVFTFQWNT